MAVEFAADSGASERTAPVKRMRWATQRQKGIKGAIKRRSIFNRHAARQSGGGSNRDSGTTLASEIRAHEVAEDLPAEAQQPRTIFFNTALPAEMRDEDGHPINHYKRNKIRTAKYTPLSFIPKNLWFQLHNVANIYFIFVVILGFFPIFGVTDPGLNAAPIIVILCITAIKDAIEDTRRTILDTELNNAPVHRLVDWENVNSADEQISLWRRFKKSCTRATLASWRWIKSTYQQRKGKHGSGDQYNDQGLDEQLAVQERRKSALTAYLDSEERQPGDVEMTPVPSPTPGQQQFGADGQAQTMGVAIPGTEQVQELPIAKKNNGNLINPFIDAPEKARFKRDYWKSVRVGDFVRLYNGEEIPADIVILSTSDEDGACYIETKNLDGETNLKVRTALLSGRQVKRARDCERTQFVLESEPPHANLYSYSGAVRWTDRTHNDPKGRDMAEPVTINNLLLRGCTVRNTEWVLGVVAFTGEDTKIMLNAGITPAKRPKIMRDMNWNVIYNFIILFCMCLVAGIVEGTTWAKGNQSLDFFEYGNYGGSAAVNGLITFWAAIILFQNLVPISLYISLEIVRSIQAFFIFSDTFMYYDKIDYPCTPKSWNISDDLGQVEYIFSDKTGTLTQNVMEFKKCTINGEAYGEAYTEALAGMQKRQGIDTVAEGAKARKQIEQDRITMIDRMRKLYNNPYLRDEDLTFVSSHFVDDLKGDAGPVQRAANERFMLALALCHSVVTERTPGDPPKIEFKAQSPDEAALVSTARDVGFTVMGRSSDGIIINYLGDELEYTVLNTLEFNSTRKRMSSILRMPDGKIVLFCKGADSVIYARLKKGEQAELRRTTGEHLEMFAREGLRTLCIAQRELSEEEYQTWNADYEIAAAAVHEREEKLEEVSDAIERELTLLGGTAIEDRLQDGVPDAIALLADAGIKLWVLTGDRVETAINIGFSCNLLGNDMDLIVLKIEDENMELAEQELDQHLATFNKTGSDEELAAAKKNHEAPAPTHALVIDGDTLKLVLDEKLRQKFLILCKECKSVLCCRVSPAQKAAVVSLVKHTLQVMTLSIGDGANDVAMIQEADVGVGIAGEEGRQAAMSSDYAFGQFRFLTRLLLVHGRWDYRRMAECIANFFYKNVIWAFSLFWYQIYDNFDCSYDFDYTYIVLFNLAFTSLPVILIGILDQDIDDKVSLAVPQLYRRGIEQKEWTQTKFWIYMIDGLYQSVICFYFTYLLFRPGNFVTETGQNVNDLKRLGIYVLNPAVVVVNLYILINTYRWDWFMLLITSISCLLVFFWTGVYTSFTDGFTFYGAAAQCYGALTFWAILMLTVIAALLPRFTAKAFQKMYMPYDIDVVREQVRQGKYDYLQNTDPYDVISSRPKELADSTTSSEVVQPARIGSASRKQAAPVEEDMRPIYPPSVTTHNPRSHNGSDGTDYTYHRTSIDRAFPQVGSPTTPITPIIMRDDLSDAPPRPSFDRPRPSFERVRSSMDRTRPSFEASRDFTSAAYLSRVESNLAEPQQNRRGASRTRDVSNDLRS